MTPNYDVPADWIDGAVSRKPLVLVNAYAFSKSANPPPDQWTHFARLRPVPWRTIVTFLVIAVVCVWGGVGMMLQYGPGMILSWFMLVVLGIGALFLELPRSVPWSRIALEPAGPVSMGWVSVDPAYRSGSAAQTPTCRGIP